MHIVWTLLGALLFATMAVIIKIASSTFNSFEIVFYRGLVGVAFLWGYMRWRGDTLATRVPLMHLWRSVVGNLSLIAWFYAIAVLPLATAMTLNYMSSVWIAAFLLGGAVLTQGANAPLRQQSPLLLTVLAGFVGVALLLRPSFNETQALGGLVGLMSGMFAALAYLQVAALARVGESESRTVFYFSLTAVLVGAAGMLVLGLRVPPWPALLWMLPVGILAVLGQLCLTRAYACGAPLVVANLQYSGIVFGSLYSLALFGEQLPLIGWVGMLLIVASGVAATALRAQALPRAAPVPEEH